MRKKSLRINIQNAYDVCVVTYHFLLTVCRTLVIVIVNTIYLDIIKKNNIKNKK